LQINGHVAFGLLSVALLHVALWEAPIAPGWSVVNEAL
jgi:hypothetical protein